MRRAFSDLIGVHGGPRPIDNAVPARESGDAVLPPPVEHAVPMAGRTDQWIFAELAARHGVTLTANVMVRLRDAYLSYLTDEIDQPVPGKSILPGVRPLLDTLAARSDVVLGLLTGNLAAGARIKLEHFDLWGYFAGGGFGDHAAERTALYADAIASITAATGEVFSPAQTVIVGDTPHDVAVALASGARCLAVATGNFGPDALTAAGAERVLMDLRDLDRSLVALELAPSPAT